MDSSSWTSCRGGIARSASPTASTSRPKAIGTWRTGSSPRSVLASPLARRMTAGRVGTLWSERSATADCSCSGSARHAIARWRDRPPDAQPPADRRLRPRGRPGLARGRPAAPGGRGQPRPGVRAPARRARARRDRRLPGPRPADPGRPRAVGRAARPARHRPRRLGRARLPPRVLRPGPGRSREPAGEPARPGPLGRAARGGPAAPAGAASSSASRPSTRPTACPPSWPRSRPPSPGCRPTSSSSTTARATRRRRSPGRTARTSSATR